MEPRSSSRGQSGRAASSAAAAGRAITERGGTSSGGNSDSHHKPEKKSKSRECRRCGQHHSHHEPHLYDYVDEVDEDLMCQICLQPFVQPLDTPCGHTFCHVCMHNYLKVNPMCPLDRKPLNEMTCSPSNLVLKRLLDKLLVTCPNADSCQEQVQRGNLDDHLRYRCSGTLVACQFAASGCDYRGPTKSMSKHQTECRFKKEGKKEFFLLN
jgi:ligand of Numb protein X 1/2